MKKCQRTVLILQGGGALGAYQAGVFDALSHGEINVDWVIGTSIDAINGAVIAGNPPERRAAKLRAFWESLSSDTPALSPAWLMSMPWLQNASRSVATSNTMTHGVPVFYATLRCALGLAAGDSRAQRGTATRSKEAE